MKVIDTRYYHGKTLDMDVAISAVLDSDDCGEPQGKVERLMDEFKQLRDVLERHLCKNVRTLEDLNHLAGYERFKYDTAADPF